MAAPVLTTTYPADGDVGIPLGTAIVLTFDRSVDLETIKTYVAIYGDVTDQISGPDPGTFLTKEGARPYLFRSPGFKGLVPFTVSAQYLDAGDSSLVDDEFEDYADEQAAGVVYRVTLTPNKPLAPEVEFQYQVIGDPISLGKGVSARTIWNPIPDPGNAGSTGFVEAKGSYTGAVADDLVIEIVSAGAVGAAKYKWYWVSEGDGTGKSGRLTNTGYLTVDKGVAIRFTGTDFEVGDQYTIHVDPLERLADSYKIAFTTTDNEYTVAPDSPSTPAEASAPATVIPPAPGAAIAETVLRVLDISPEEGAYNISLHTDTIEITFSDPIDPATVTTDTVQLYAVPVEGIFGGRGGRRAIAYSLSVSGNKIIISL